MENEENKKGGETLPSIGLVSASENWTTYTKMNPTRTSI